MAEPARVPEEYGADSIKVLKGLEAVRKRPGMYIGDTDDGSGLHHMVYEVVDNGIDEALGGWATEVSVTLHADGVGQRHRQRPRHPGGHPRGRGGERGRGHHDPAARGREVRPEQLQGVGRAARRRRQRGERALRLAGAADLARGVRALRAVRGRRSRWRACERVGPAEGRRGTEVRFLASTRDVLEPRLQLQDAGAPAARARVPELGRADHADATERHAEIEEVVLAYEGGVREFVSYLDRSKTPLIGAPIYIAGERGGIGVEVAMWWNDSYHETVLPFTNNIPQRDGGTHLAGFRGALTRTINAYAGESGLAKREKVALSGDDAREGLTCVLSVKVPDPKFSVADQGQAGLLRGAAGGRGAGRREARRVVRGEPGRGADRGRQDRRGGDGAGGGAQGARAHPAQDGDGRGEPAGQARRLPGEGPGEGGDLPRRGRQRRRVGEAGAEPGEPGGAAAPRQDPERRAGAVRPDARRARRSAR